MARFQLRDQHRAILRESCTDAELELPGEAPNRPIATEWAEGLCSLVNEPFAKDLDKKAVAF